jgi:hypothetical protein
MDALKTTYLHYPLEGLRLAKAEKWLFTAKELRIIKKLLDVQPLDKLEANRYYRTIKPKINAIIDFYSIALIVRSKE